MFFENKRSSQQSRYHQSSSPVPRTTPLTNGLLFNVSNFNATSQPSTLNNFAANNIFSQVSQSRFHSSSGFENKLLSPHYQRQTFHSRDLREKVLYQNSPYGNQGDLNLQNNQQSHGPLSTEDLAQSKVSKFDPQQFPRYEETVMDSYFPQRQLSADKEKKELTQEVNILKSQLMIKDSLMRSRQRQIELMKEENQRLTRSCKNQMSLNSGSTSYSEKNELRVQRQEKQKTFFKLLESQNQNRNLVEKCRQLQSQLKLQRQKNNENNSPIRKKPVSETLDTKFSLKDQIIDTKTKMIEGLMKQKSDLQNRLRDKEIELKLQIEKNEDIRSFYTNKISKMESGADILDRKFREKEQKSKNQGEDTKEGKLKTELQKYKRELISKSEMIRYLEYQCQRHEKAESPSYSGANISNEKESDKLRDLEEQVGMLRKVMEKSKNEHHELQAMKKRFQMQRHDLQEKLNASRRQANSYRVSASQKDEALQKIDRMNTEYLHQINRLKHQLSEAYSELAEIRETHQAELKSHKQTYERQASRSSKEFARNSQQHSKEIQRCRTNHLREIEKLCQTHRIELDSLKESNQKLRKELKQLEQNLFAVTENNIQIEDQRFTENNKLNSEKQRLIDALQNKTIQLDQLKIRYQALQQQQTPATKSAIEQLNYRNKDLQEQLTQKSRQLKHVTSMYYTYEQLNQEAHEEMIQYKDQVLASRKEIDLLKRTLQNAEIGDGAQTLLLQKELNSLRELSNNYYSQIETLEAENSQLRTNIQQLNSDYQNNLKALQDRHQFQIQDLQKQVVDLEQLNTQFQQDKNKAREQLQNQIIENLQNHNTQSQMSSRIRRVINDDKQRIVAIANSQIKRLKEQLVHSADKLKTAESTVSTIQSQHEQMARKAARIADEKDKLMTQIADLIKEKNEAELKLNSSPVKQHENKQLLNRIKGLESSNQSHEALISMLRQEEDRLKRKIAQNEKSYAELDKQNIQLCDANQNLQIELNRLSGQIKSLKNKYDQLADQNMELKSEVSMLQLGQKKEEENQSSKQQVDYSDSKLINSSKLRDKRKNLLHLINRMKQFVQKASTQENQPLGDITHEMKQLLPFLILLTTKPHQNLLNSTESLEHNADKLMNVSMAAVFCDEYIEILQLFGVDPDIEEHHQILISEINNFRESIKMLVDKVNTMEEHVDSLERENQNINKKNSFLKNDIKKWQDNIRQHQNLIRQLNDIILRRQLAEFSIKMCQKSLMVEDERKQEKQVEIENSKGNAKQIGNLFNTFAQS